MNTRPFTIMFLATVMVAGIFSIIPIQYVAATHLPLVVNIGDATTGISVSPDGVLSDIDDTVIIIDDQLQVGTSSILIDGDSNPATITSTVTSIDINSVLEGSDVTIDADTTDGTDEIVVTTGAVAIDGTLAVTGAFSVASIEISGTNPTLTFDDTDNAADDGVISYDTGGAGTGTFTIDIAGGGTVFEIDETGFIELIGGAEIGTVVGAGNTLEIFTEAGNGQTAGDIEIISDGVTGIESSAGNIIIESDGETDGAIAIATGPRGAIVTGEIDLTASGAVDINAVTGITINAGTGDVAIASATGAITIDATDAADDLTLSAGDGVNILADDDEVDITATLANVDINAVTSSSFTIQTAANLPGTTLSLENISTGDGNDSGDIVIRTDNTGTTAGSDAGSILISTDTAGADVSDDGGIDINAGTDATDPGDGVLRLSSLNALTITAGTASTWSTTTGALTIETTDDSVINLDANSAGDAIIEVIVADDSINFNLADAGVELLITDTTITVANLANIDIDTTGSGSIDIQVDEGIEAPGTSIRIAAIETGGTTEDAGDIIITSDTSNANAGSDAGDILISTDANGGDDGTIAISAGVDATSGGSGELKLDSSGATTITAGGTGLLTIATTNNILAIEARGAAGVLDLNTVTAGIAIEAGDSTLNDPVDGTIDLRATGAISIIPTGNFDATAGGTGTANIATTNNILSIQAAGADGVIDINTVTAGIAIEAGDSTLNDPVDGEIDLIAAQGISATAGGTGLLTIATTNNILAIEARGAAGVLDLNTVTAGIAIEAGDSTLNDPVDGTIDLRATGAISIIPAGNFDATAGGTGTVNIETTNNILSIQAAGADGVLDLNTDIAGIAIEAGDTTLNDPVDGTINLLSTAATTITAGGTGILSLVATNNQLILDSNLGDGTIELETQTAGIALSAGGDAPDPTDAAIEFSGASTDIELEISSNTIQIGFPDNTDTTISIDGSVVFDDDAFLTFTPGTSDQALITASDITADAVYKIILTSGDTNVTLDDPNIVGGLTGQILILQSGETGTNTITFTEGQNVRLTGALVLAATDSVIFIFDGTDWIEISRSNIT